MIACSLVLTKQRWVTEQSKKLLGLDSLYDQSCICAQVNGRLIVPAAVMLELAMAAAATLAEGAATSALTSVSISVPLLLPDLERHSLLEVAVGHSDGAVEVRSAAAGAGRGRQLHCRGNAARLAPPTLAGESL